MKRREQSVQNEGLSCFDGKVTLILQSLWVLPPGIEPGYPDYKSGASPLML